MKLASYFFAMFAFVCNANTYNDWAKGNAVNLNGSSVQNGVATPSPNAPHDNGNPIGYNISSREAIFFDANGKIKYTQTGDGAIKKNGEVIGKNWNNGKIEWNCRTEETCKSTLNTVDKNFGLKCDEGVCRETKVVDGEKIYRTMAEAVLASRSKFNGACSAESSYNVLKTKVRGADGEFGYLVALRGYYDDGEKAKGSAPLNIKSVEADFEVVAVLHNHPTKSGVQNDWFSTADAITAKIMNKDMILYGCTTDTFLWLHTNENGKVTDLSETDKVMPQELVAHQITDKEVNGEIGETLKSAKSKGFVYYRVSSNKDGRKVVYVHKEFESTPYNPDSWNTLGGGKDITCSGIEGVCIHANERAFDFCALVPDRIWTEPIIGALCDEKSKKVDWWGSKWMGGTFELRVPREEHTLEHYSSHGSVKHCIGFSLKSPWLLEFASLEKCPLEEALQVMEKIKSTIESNTGVHLEVKKKNSEKKEFGESYDYAYFIDAEFCQIDFAYWINTNKDKRGNTRFDKIDFKASLSVDCTKWFERRMNLDCSCCSVRDLVQGNVKRK